MYIAHAFQHSGWSFYAAWCIVYHQCTYVYMACGHVSLSYTLYSCASPTFFHAQQQLGLQGVHKPIPSKLQFTYLEWRCDRLSDANILLYVRTLVGEVSMVNIIPLFSPATPTSAPSDSQAALSISKDTHPTTWEWDSLWNTCTVYCVLRTDRPHNGPQFEGEQEGTCKRDMAQSTLAEPTADEIHVIK